MLPASPTEGREAVEPLTAFLKSGGGPTTQRPVPVWPPQISVKHCELNFGLLHMAHGDACVHFICCLQRALAPTGLFHSGYRNNTTGVGEKAAAHCCRAVDYHQQ
uniref:Secreted protein n=1 Tax=Ascaris lumbricoides TaxID=6252 RepID=A0A0M3HQ70_ASCLU